MTPIFRSSARAWRRVIVAALLLASLSSTIGCARRYVAVDAGAPAAATQGDLDRCYSDNELLLQRLEQCGCK